ncbi:hypothetical protein D7V21_05300 [Acinetobacter guerrae]|uniref:DUF2514 family protein n=1 Tax=Acinetobacter guerrae TaxID=1843371 RepID=A0A3A8ENY3_9GAMM|nr:hypothetical protein [Acinetobacter guerrae]RKG35196.1 hypothetical protein D7V21_05300 [Acinetobacter guerrae]
MSYLYLVLKYWRECIIVVLAFLLLICLFIQNHQAAEIKDQKQQHADYITQQKLAVEKAKIQAAQHERRWAEQITQAEQNYNAKIKQIESDASDAQSSANSLSKQLSIAKQRLSAASRETVIEYADSSSDILESCITEYRNVAQKADEHAADAERLSNAWP